MEETDKSNGTTQMHNTQKHYEWKIVDTSNNRKQSTNVREKEKKED